MLPLPRLVIGLAALSFACDPGATERACTSGSDCSPGETCLDGVCTSLEDGSVDAFVAPGCEPPRAVCNGFCIDTTVSSENCGGCGIRCDSPTRCVSGVCAVPCAPTDPPAEICDGVDNDCDGLVDPDPCGSDLVAWYRFEELDGALLDASGNDLHGTVMGGVTRGASGVDGAAYSFDGASGTRIEIADGPRTVFGEALTVEAFVAPLDCAHGASDHNTVVAKENELLLAFNASCGVANYVNAGTWVGDFPARTVPTLAFVHYALTYDGVMLRSYLRGTQVGETMVGGPLMDTDAALYIGARPDCCEQTFRGRIDEVRIWSSVRTAEQLCASAGGMLVDGACRPSPTP